MEMTQEKLDEIQKRILGVVREYGELSVNDVIALFAFMLGKVIRMSTFWNEKVAIGVFRDLIPGIENMFKNTFEADVFGILNTINEINEEEGEE